jgi:2-keto-4-pentenoate hydratase/2-oxohepta-3-ene-1,7-dioic acid hydratase in catechol pathway
VRIVGVRRSATEVDAAQLSKDGTTLHVMTDVAGFWSAPQEWLARPPSGEVLSTDGAPIVPPLRPDAQVLCVGLNYKDHALEGSYRDQPLPPFPTIFGRWARSLSVDGTEIPVPAGEDGLDWEGEVVAWVGRPLVEATSEEALTAVFGYSAFNDITARRAQKLTSQWSLGKNADRSGAIGPIVPASEVGDIREGLRIRTWVNGEKVQDGSTREMIYSVGDVLAHVSQTITLLPGDLLATGTPAGVGYGRTPPWLLIPGDTVEVEVERLGKVCNSIVSSDSRGLGSRTSSEVARERGGRSETLITHASRTTKLDAVLDSQSLPAAPRPTD